MAKTVGDFVVERLRAWGVQRVFGYPGDGINGIMAGFEHAGDEGPRFIQARHEELAAFMAGAHAKFTGEPGVCLADRPVLVEAVVDPEFPMMPPHVTLREAKAYAKSVLKGDPEAKHMIGETIRTAVAGVFKKGKKDD